MSLSLKHRDLHFEVEALPKTQILDDVLVACSSDNDDSVSFLLRELLDVGQETLENMVAESVAESDVFNDSKES
jgi:hypothetical protein